MDHLICSLRGFRFGVPRAAIAEIVELTSVVPIPGAAKWAAGVAVVRDEVVWVVSVDGARDASPTLHTAAPKAVRLSARGGSVAIAVDATYEFRSLPEATSSAPRDGRFFVVAHDANDNLSQPQMDRADIGKIVEAFT
jgi:chemotaxis signal transduction protein